MYECEICGLPRDGKSPTNNSGPHACVTALRTRLEEAEQQLARVSEAWVDCKKCHTLHEAVARAREDAIRSIAKGLIDVRDNLVHKDYDEAWHSLYGIADPTFTLKEPWKELEQLSTQPAPQPPMTFRQLQDEQRPWVAHNFPDREAVYPLLGAVEELGELSHAHLKGMQGIRGTAEEHHAAKIDAVADTIIFLSDYCEASGIDLQDAIETTWAEVKTRDWKADPVNGQPAPHSEKCDHEWIDVRNDVIASGEMCRKCNAVRQDTQ